MIFLKKSSSLHEPGINTLRLIYDMFLLLFLKSSCKEETL